MISNDERREQLIRMYGEANGQKIFDCEKARNDLRALEKPRLNPVKKAKEIQSEFKAIG